MALTATEFHSPLWRKCSYELEWKRRQYLLFLYSKIQVLNYGDIEKKADAEQAAIDMIHSTDRNSQDCSALNNKPRGSHSFKDQVKALLIKRLHSSPRDYRTLFFSFAVPLLFAILAVVVAKVVSREADFMAQNITPLPLSSFPNNRFIAVTGGADFFTGSSFIPVSSNTSMKDYLKQYPFNNYYILQ